MIESKSTSRYWNQRLHKARYTRNGVSHAVRHWSIKLQHQGIRRSISLSTASRSLAARRALQLYQVIIENGWHTADDLISQFQNGSPAPKNNVPQESRGTLTASYWKQRLAKRSYLRQAGLSTPEQWSVRIDRAGINDYFPTNSTSIETAIRYAANLNTRISQSGWRIACSEFPREFTIALFWSVDPVTCTYATMVSLIEKKLEVRLPLRGRRRRVMVVEPSREIAETIAFWIGQNDGFKVEHIASDLTTARSAIDDETWDLVLINRQASNPTAFTNQVRKRINNPPPAMVGYGLYVDSNEIFRSVSGVERGYCLRRRNPNQILAPIASQTFDLPLASIIPLTVKSYYQNLFTEMAHSETPSHLNLLTRRELEILEHLSAGYLDKEIAQRLQISNWTVRNHLKRIYSKLGIHNRTEAVIQYLQK